MPTEKLGMNVKGGATGQPGNPFDKDDEGVFISKINPNGAAARDGRLRPGMRIIEVNEVSLLGATHQEAVHALRNVGNKIVLLVCDGYEPSEVPKRNSNIPETPTPTSPTSRSFKSFSSVDKEDDDVFATTTPKPTERKRQTSSDSLKQREASVESLKNQSTLVTTNAVINNSEETVSETKNVDQKVMDVMKAAEQLTKTSTNAYSSQSNASKEQKTTTVIMKKHNVNTGVVAAQQATTVSPFSTISPFRFNFKSLSEHFTQNLSNTEFFPNPPFPTVQR